MSNPKILTESDLVHWEAWLATKKLDKAFSLDTDMVQVFVQTIREREAQLQAEQERSAGLYEALQAFAALFAEIEAKAKEQEREIQTARERVAELEQELLYFRMDEADSL